MSGILSFIVGLIELATAALYRAFVAPRIPALAQLLEPLYSLRPLVGPALAGLPLRVFVCVLRLPVLGALLLRHLMRDNGFDDVVTFAGNVDEPYPMALPPAAAGRMAAASSWSYGAPTATTTQANNNNSAFAVALPRSTILQLHAQFRSGAVTPLAHLDRVFAAIDASDAAAQPLRSFVRLDRAGAIAAATASAKRFASGSAPLSYLDGVPVGVKCCIPVAGFPTTLGSRILENDPVATHDAESVRRLRAAGAIIVGLNNMHELGIGGTGANGHYGSARNPHDRSRASGGSSSGGAAAVAAGIIPLALCTDGGGSIRIPAGLCGVAGIKPGFGVVPARPGVAWSCYSEGPIAATVEDCRIALEVLAGAAVPPLPLALAPSLALDVPSSALTAASTPTATTTTARRTRIGIFRAFANDASAAMQRACDIAEARLRGLGCEIVEISVPNLKIASVAHAVIILSEIVAGLQHKRHAFPECDPASQVSLLLGSNVTATQLLAAYVVRDWLTANALPRIFAECDFVLTPNTSMQAPAAAPEPWGQVNIQETSGLIRFCFLSNLLGTPAATVTVGMADSGDAAMAAGALPIAVHLMGNFGSEAALLGAASMLEPTAQAALRPRVNYFAPYL